MCESHGQKKYPVATLVYKYFICSHWNTARYFLIMAWNAEKYFLASSWNTGRHFSIFSSNISKNIGKYSYSCPITGQWTISNIAPYEIFSFTISFARRFQRPQICQKIWHFYAVLNLFHFTSYLKSTANSYCLHFGFFCLIAILLCHIHSSKLLISLHALMHIDPLVFRYLWGLKTIRSIFT